MAAAIACLTSLLSASQARAQLGAAVSLVNDYRFRGYSLSDGHPAATLVLTYDHRSGLYGAVSGSAIAAHHEGVKPLGLLVNAGYATSISSRVALDVGIAHSSYSKYSDRAASLTYSELYVGVSGKLVSARLNLSPDYVTGGSAYGEINGSWPLATKLSLTGHAGVLVPFERTHPGYSYSHDVDWRLGLIRQFGPVSAQVAWSALRPGHGGYRQHNHNRDALVLGLTYGF